MTFSLSVKSPIKKSSDTKHQLNYGQSRWNIWYNKIGDEECQKHIKSAQKKQQK